jgi:hypothetical protein
MTAPENAPMAAPDKAPVPVLSGEPFGFTQPVNNMDETATASIRA